MIEMIKGYELPKSEDGHDGVGSFERCIPCGQYGAYGALNIFCGDLDVVLDRLKLALAQSEQIGSPVTESSAYLTARSYYDRASGFFSGAVVLIGSACADALSEATKRLVELNDVNVAYGAIPIAPPPPPSESPITSWEKFIGWLPWIAVGVGGVAVILIAKNMKLSDLIPGLGPARRVKRALGR